jgi:cell division protein FtsB
MTNFLAFLNTADIDTLTKIPGITTAIANNIIEARPFDSVDACLNVHGMGKNLLARMQSNFEAGENPSEYSAMIQIEEEAAPAPIEKSQPVQESVQEEDSFFSRLRQVFLSFIRALFRLIALALVIGGIGALLYYSLPFINQEVIVPIQENRVQIDKLAAEVDTVQTQLAAEVDTLQTQLNETNNRVTAVEKSIEAQTASLTKLDEIQAILENEIQTSHDEVLLQLKHEVMFTRALDMLERARLYLAQSNFGLAREDVKSARDLLVTLHAETNDEILELAIARLDLALGNLPAFPVIASGDLEIAWQILMSGEAPVTSAPEPTTTSTPTVEPTVDITPTAIP